MDLSRRGHLRCSAALVVALLQVALGLAARATPLAAYQQALREAAVAAPDQPPVPLKPLPSPEAGTVRVVSWKSRQAYGALLRGPATAPPEESGRLLWVTLPPQLQEFCRLYLQQHPKASQEQLDLRLKQYLGLDPRWSYDVVVSIEVDAADLIRPCPDPRPANNICPRSFPGQAREPLALQGSTPGARIRDYPSFLSRLYFESIHTGLQPFTALGYTHDWSTSPGQPGATELVIVPGAPIRVLPGAPGTAAYCSP